MRQGENALAVIDRVKAKLKEIQPGLPAGVKVVPIYDRSDLILRSIDNLKRTLIEELVIVALVILVFLWHFPSAIIPVLTIPISIVLAFIPMRLMGVTSNIMSLGGIAIAVGAMVDAAIVVVEQTHKKLEEWERNGRQEDYHRVVINAVKEVGGPSFFALLVIAVSFPAGAHPGSAGRAPVQTARLHQEFLHDHRGGARHHARPRLAAAVHAHAEFRVSPALAGARHERGPGRQDPLRGKPPHQQDTDPALSPGCGMVAALEVGDHRGGRGHCGRHHPHLPEARLGVQCRRSM